MKLCYAWRSRKKQQEAGRSNVAMLTKSIRLTEEEAAQVKEYVALTGEVEATVLKRAALRGFKEMRLEQGILAYIQGEGSAEAAAIAGVGRAEFLWLLAERGVPLLKDPLAFSDGLEYLAEQLGDKRLAAIARTLSDPPAAREKVEFSD
jgi:hypothetical protein